MAVILSQMKTITAHIKIIETPSENELMLLNRLPPKKKKKKKKNLAGYRRPRLYGLLNRHFKK